MYNNNAAVILQEIKQLQEQFETALSSGQTFEEVKAIYLRIKELISQLDERNGRRWPLGSPQDSARSNN